MATRTRHRDKYAHLRQGAGDRSHFRADGAPKRPFDTETAAELVLIRRAQAGKPDNMHTYRCPVCTMFHVGRLPLSR